MPLPGEGLAAGISSAAKRPISDNHSPAVASPARIATPPPPSERRYSEARTSDYSRHGRSSTRTSELNPEAVDHALRREIHRQQREGTPGSSPHRKRQRINGDRYAPFITSWMMAIVNSLTASFRPARARTCRPASACCTKMGRLPHPLGRRSGLLTENCTFKGVSRMPANG